MLYELIFMCFYVLCYGIGGKYFIYFNFPVVVLFLRFKIIPSHIVLYTLLRRGIIYIYEVTSFVCKYNHKPK